MTPTIELPESAATAAGHTRGLSFGIITSLSRDLHETVVPAKAGTHLSTSRTSDGWIPAFAGMTTYKTATPITAHHEAPSRDRARAAIGRSQMPRRATR